MSGKSYDTYDFRARSGYTDAASIALNSWLKKTAGVFAERWRDMSSSGITVSVKNITTRSFESAVASNSQPTLGCVVNIGASELLAMWLATRTDVLSLVGQVLCDAAEELEDRELTSVEHSVCRLIFEYFTQSLCEAWPLQELLECTVVEMENNPSRARILAARDEVLYAELTIAAAGRDTRICWLIGKDAARPLLIGAFDEPSKTKTKFDTTAIVNELPLELVGVLGNVDLPMSRLSDLNDGDLIVLDQRIDQPMVATIDGNPFCLCWPGLVGKTKGIEISELV